MCHMWIVYVHNRIVDFSISVKVVDNCYVSINLRKSRRGILYAWILSGTIIIHDVIYGTGLTYFEDHDLNSQI